MLLLIGWLLVIYHLAEAGYEIPAAVILVIGIVMMADARHARRNARREAREYDYRLRTGNGRSVGYFSARPFRAEE